MESPKKSPSNISINEGSTITFKIKDALAIASFLIYVGISIAGFYYAKQKLDDLEEGNNQLKKQVAELEIISKGNNSTLKEMQSELIRLRDYIIYKKK